MSHNTCLSPLLQSPLHGQYSLQNHQEDLSTSPRRSFSSFKVEEAGMFKTWGFKAQGVLRQGEFKAILKHSLLPSLYCQEKTIEGSWGYHF